MLNGTDSAQYHYLLSKTTRSHPRAQDEKKNSQRISVTILSTGKLVAPKSPTVYRRLPSRTLGNGKRVNKPYQEKYTASQQNQYQLRHDIDLQNSIKSRQVEHIDASPQHRFPT